MRLHKSHMFLPLAAVTVQAGTGASEPRDIAGRLPFGRAACPPLLPCLLKEDFLRMG